MAQDKILYCNFCGKSKDEVKKLIAGPNVFICDECVSLCAEICTDAEIARAVDAPLLTSQVTGLGIQVAMTAETVWTNFDLDGSGLLQEALGVSLDGTPNAAISAGDAVWKILRVVYERAKPNFHRNLVQERLNEVDRRIQAGAQSEAEARGTLDRANSLRVERERLQALLPKQPAGTTTA